MKINRYIKQTIFAIAVLALSGSCKKDFLEKSPTSFINVDDYGYTSTRNPAVLNATLDGVYTTLFDMWTGGTERHDDFGQKGWDIYTDFLSGDLALSVSTYGWYRRLVNYDATTDYARAENYMPWRYYYKIIKSTNVIIDALTANGAPTTDSGKAGLGQAKALRAYAYFYLSQLYITEYDPASKVLPLYDDPTQVAEPKATTEDIYNLMITDLTDAIDLLNGFTRTNKIKINQDVAKGLLAYVYASMDTPANNQKAKDLAEEIIATGTYPIMNSTEVVGGFNDASTPGWMWGVDITTDNGLDLVSWWGQMDVFTYSYQWAGDVKSIDEDLFNSITANDVRKTQFYTDPNSSYYLIPFNKFYDSNRSIGGQREITTDYVFMRIAEFYLLSAEMSAKLGQDIDARNRLKDLLAQRFAAAADYAYVDALSGVALQDEIYLQTRIELFAEGKSYLALKRNKKTVHRGPNHLYQAGIDVLYNDPRLTFEIPLSEVQNNPNLDN